MVRSCAVIAATLLAGFVAGTAHAQSFHSSTPEEIREKFRTDPKFAARYHSFDRATPGIIAAGNTEPNPEATGQRPPPGDKVYSRSGLEVTNCSSQVETIRWPDGQERQTRLFACVRP